MKQMEAYVTRSLTRTSTSDNLINDNSLFRIITSRTRTLLLPALLCGTFFALTVDDAYAQRANRNNEQPEPIEGRQFGAKAGEIVNEALTFITSEQHSAALGKLSQALALPVLNPYERATIYQMQGSSYYVLNQYTQAIQAFENAISSGGLLPKESASLRVNIAQLLIASGQAARGAQMMEDWNRSGGQLNPKHIELLWQAWSQAENYSRALPWAEKWFRAASPKERKHFDLLNFMYSNLNLPDKQADIAKQMINRWPNDKKLWDAWASLLVNGGREQESFEVTKMLYLGGALTSQADLEKVVQYYSFYDMPYQAANILQREMNAGNISQSSGKLVQLSDLFRQAREYKKALPALEKAANSSGKAKLYADWGEALYKENQCAKAETAFKKAMSLGYDQGKSWMLIASCRYDDAALEKRPQCPFTEEKEANDPWSVKRKAAVTAFENVPSSSTEGRNATKWRTFVAGEKSALKKRCIFEIRRAEDICNADIRRAYKSEFLDGKFTLQNKNCMKYKAKFDSIFKKNKKDEDKK